MENSLHLEMCFISKSNELLIRQVEKELHSWFALPSKWFIHSKKEQELLVVTAEVHAKGEWVSEDALLQYIEDNLHVELIERLYGYQVKMETNQKGGCCSCGKTG